MKAMSHWLQKRKLEIATLLAMEDEETSLLGLAEWLGGVGHWWIRLPDFAITWSAAIYEIYGLNPESYTPEIASNINFFHVDDRHIVTKALRAAAGDQTPFEFSVRLIRADGQLRYVKLRGFSIAGPDNVPARIFGVLVDITEERMVEDFLRAENFKLQQLAYVDALTQLANRRHFEEKLNSEWLRAKREQTPVSLIILDIDHFKRFNDLYGHVVGDDCLRMVAATMEAVLRRPGDLAARFGGEEFALLLPGTDVAGAEKLAHAVRTAIEALQLNHEGNAACGRIVTVSVGVATYYPQPALEDGPFDLVNKADKLLYQAKRSGRNKVASPSNFAAACVFLPADGQVSLVSRAFVNQPAPSSAGPR